MCGIVGSIGNEQVSPILLQGLKNLEYRGWNGCNESEFNTWCANCDVLIEGVEGEGY